MARIVSDIGGEPVNQGERRVIKLLKDELPDDYGILPNIELRDRHGQLREIDCIVTAPHAVYVIEIKDYSGDIEGDDREWLYRGRPQPSPSRQNNLKAKVLKSFLQETRPELRRAWVEAYVVLARQPAQLDLKPAAREKTLLLDELVDKLVDPAHLTHKVSRFDDLPTRVEAVLTPAIRKRRGPRRFGAWEVVEQLDEEADVTHYQASNTLAPNAPQVRLAVWGLSSYLLTDAERTVERTRVVREFTALQHMGSHPGIVGASDAFEEDNLVVVVSAAPTGTTLGLMLSGGFRMADDERLAYIDDLAAAVEHAHASGVIHRRIRPEVVFVDNSRMRLGGFGHARVAVEGTIQHNHAADLGLDGGYVAPEVTDPALGPTTEASDLFSLATIAWSLWTGERLPGDWHATGGFPWRPDGMPDRLWDVVENLLSIDPVQRTASVDDLRNAVAHALATDFDPRRADTGHTDLPAAPAEYAVGSMIHDRYEVIARLGVGGFATVYRVHDRPLATDLAVKVLDARHGLEAAQREARALLDITHPNVVRVRHIANTPTTPTQWYITSDLVSGEPLSNFTTPGSLLPVHDALEVISQLLDACINFHPDQARIDMLATRERRGDLDEPEQRELAACRQKGIIHRDIKPSNIVYDTSTKHATLIDFNIASPAGSDIATLAGSPGYQPPDPDPTAWGADPDLFGLGVVLFELLTGDHPYPLRRPSAGGVREVTAFRSDAPPALNAVCARACSPQRADRFTTAVEFRDALRAATSPHAYPHTAKRPGTEAHANDRPSTVAATTVAADHEATTRATRSDPADTVDIGGSPTEPDDGASTPGRGPTRTDAPPSRHGDISVNATSDGSDQVLEPKREGSSSRLVLAISAMVIAASIVAGGVILASESGEPSTASPSETATSTVSSSTTVTTVRPSTTGSTVHSDTTEREPTPAVVPPPTAVPVPIAAPEAAPNGQDCPPGFPVKGNESQSGELIYHEPGWRYFDQTWPERCFATVEAATDAGFRASEIQ